MPPTRPAPLRARAASVEFDGRALVLRRHEAELLRIPLDRGGRYRLIADHAAPLLPLLAALDAAPGIALIPANGGLPGALPVAESMALALHFNGDLLESDLAAWDAELRAVFASCGIDVARAAALCRARPMDLARDERWLTGFARMTLQPPELLVFDRNFLGLARRDAEALLAHATVFQRWHPFRPCLFIDLDSHELPPLPECAASVELEAAAGVP